MSKIVVAMGDLHVGSYYGLRPSSITLPGGGEVSYPPGSMHDWLWQYYISCTQYIKDRFGKVDDVILYGDITDGTNYKDGGSSQWSTDRDTQIEVATQIVKELPIKDSTKFFGIEGSRYHTGRDRSSDKGVIATMKNEGRTAHYDYDMIIDVEEVPFYVRHKPGISSNWHYRSTPLAKEMLFHQLHKDVFGKVSVFLFGHGHYYCSVEYANSKAIEGACFKLRDPFIRVSSNALGYVPKIGMLVFRVDGSHYELYKLLTDIPTEHSIGRYQG